MALENFEVSAIPDKSFPSVSVSERIQEKNQDFLISYREFNHLFKNTDDLKIEFERYTKFSDFEGNFKKMFKKYSEDFKIATTTELGLFGYIHSRNRTQIL